MNDHYLSRREINQPRVRANLDDLTKKKEWFLNNLANLLVRVTQLDDTSKQ